MSFKDIKFELYTTDPTGARRGSFTTEHGKVQTPAFMPVGTAGFVRSTLPRDVEESGAEVLLANTYHLGLEERLTTVKRMGGLHRFMGWNKTILTDSGGFQVFSLPDKEITDQGVWFSYNDKDKKDNDIESVKVSKKRERLFLSPERSMEIQRDLGADIVMAFDECVEYPTTKDYVAQSLIRTTAWAKRCREFELQKHQFLFGIVQGGVYPDLRRKSAEEITAIPFDGFAIGGVSVGEGYELMKNVTKNTTPFLPFDKPRYLMGVGLPEDILEAVGSGIDMFDCVIPTRYARQGTLFTRLGKLRIMDKASRKEKYPVDTKCSCYTCQTYSQMVLRYLFFTRDPLAETLATIHNLTFYQDLMKDIRDAIEDGNYQSFKRDWLDRYRKQNRI
ncbi:MAG: tRNA guanosine(34) transglycosylase Tgt [Desulfamplus sp.]|nr:tRNA guanosine(34) transglycosylase Tgt [Desulfamplus sp.]